MMRTRMGPARSPVLRCHRTSRWQNFKFVFSGSNGIIVDAVDAGVGFVSRLLFYHDKTQNGTGEVANPSVISQGNWWFLHSVFSGGNGIIYAIG